MKPAVFQTKPGRWHCVSDDNTISFDTWQEALAEANRAAYVQSVTLALDNFNTHMWEWFEALETAFVEKETPDAPHP